MSLRLPFFRAGLGQEFVSLRVAGGLEFQIEPGRLGGRGLVMDGGDAGFSRRQVGGGGGAEAGDDYALVLDRFGVIERRLAKGGMLAAFDADDSGHAVGGGEFELISGQRRAPGIHVDVHRAEATAAFLNSRLLRQKPRRQPKEEDGEPDSDDCSICSLPRRVAGETRDPKAEGRKKAEIRKPKRPSGAPGVRSARALRVAGHGMRG